MGRAPCCDKANVKKGPWSPEEDVKLKEYIEKNGTGGNWIALPQKAGLKRCGKSCRLRWLNYLRPNIKHGEFTPDEDRMICTLFANIGSRWSIIAAQLPGRTDNDIKNYWNTKLKKKLLGISTSHRTRSHPSHKHHQKRRPEQPHVATSTASQPATSFFHYQQQPTLAPQAPFSSTTSQYLTTCRAGAANSIQPASSRPPYPPYASAYPDGFSFSSSREYMRVTPSSANSASTVLVFGGGDQTSSSSDESASYGKVEATVAEHEIQYRWQQVAALEAMLNSSCGATPAGTGGIISGLGLGQLEEGVSLMGEPVSLMEDYGGYGDMKPPVFPNNGCNNNININSNIMTIDDLSIGATFKSQERAMYY